MQIAAVFFAFMRYYEELLAYRDQDLLDDYSWKSMESITGGVMASQGFADWWSIRGSWFSSDFQAHVRRKLEAVGRDILDDYRSLD